MFFANLTISGRIGSIEKTSISGKKTLSRPKKRFHDTFFHKSRHTPPYFFQSGTRFRPKKTKNRLLNIPPLPFFFRSKVRCRSRSIWKKISKTTFLTFFFGSIGNPFFQKSRGQKFKKMTWPPFRFFDQTPKTSNFGNSVFSGPDPFFWQFEVFDQIPEILEIRIPKTRSQNSEFQSRNWEIPKSQNRIPKTRSQNSEFQSRIWEIPKSQNRIPKTRSQNSEFQSRNWEIPEIPDPEIGKSRNPKTGSQKLDPKTRNSNPGIGKFPKSRSGSQKLDSVNRVMTQKSNMFVKIWKMNTKKLHAPFRFFEIANTNLQNLESEFRFFRFSSIFFGIPIQKINALPTKLTFYRSVARLG